MRRDRGSATIELAILTPFALMFCLVMVVAGRFTLAQQVLDSATYDASRSASLSRNADEAVVNGQAAANRSLADAGLRCQNRVTLIYTDQFARPPGTYATVQVTQTCQVRFFDLVHPGLDLSGLTIPIRSTFVSPLDTYRSRA